MSASSSDTPAAGSARAPAIDAARGQQHTDGPRTLLFVDARQVVTCAGPASARRGAEMADAGVLTGAAVAVVGEKIAAIGEQHAMERAFAGAERVSCRGCVLTPGLVDSHTHAVFGPPRAAEHELRAAGADYMAIAAEGGGIHSSVRAVRALTENELVELARPRLRRLAAHGTTTLEIKSGYGLTVDDELKTLRAIRRLAAELPMRIVPTWLGAHEIPREARAAAGGREAYLDLLTGDMLNAVALGGLARFADVFCEPGVYTVAESERVLTAAREAGMGLKLHADELHGDGGAELAVKLGAVSADHLGEVSDAGVRALAGSDTVATLLPATLLFLGRSRQAPARSLIDAGAAVALATDFNPGTSPTVNFPLVLTLGVSLLRMSVAEVMIAGTANGAAALGLSHRVGQLAPGYSADLALFEADDVRELPYWFGDRRCRGSWTRGKTCHQYELGLC